MKFEWKVHNHDEWTTVVLIFNGAQRGQYLIEYETKFTPSETEACIPLRIPVYRIGVHDKPIYDENEIRAKVLSQYLLKIEEEHEAFEKFLEEESKNIKK